MSGAARWMGAALALVLAVSGCSNAATEIVELRVAAAADLAGALEEIAELWERDRPGVHVSISYGSSGTFVQQIANGAPFDVYLSADIGYVEQLVEAGRADEADVFRYADGRLVVWVSGASDAEAGDGLDALLDDSVRRVAIANPEHAPYGEAAVAAMRAAGIYDQVEPKLVLGENVGQAAEFVQSGNADAAVMAASLASFAGGFVDEVPARLYPPIEQAGVILSRSTERDAAADFAATVTGGQAQQILQDHGFGPPGG